MKIIYCLLTILTIFATASCDKEIKEPKTSGTETIFLRVESVSKDSSLSYSEVISVKF